MASLQVPQSTSTPEGHDGAVNTLDEAFTQPSDQVCFVMAKH